MTTLPTRLFALCISTVAIFASCTPDSQYFPPRTLKEWTIDLSAKNENPNPANRTETGTAVLQLLTDNSLRYTITVNGLQQGDQLQAAHLHTGDAITNGNVILDLAPTFNGNTATGTVFIPRATLLDSLTSGKDIYLNVHSAAAGAGLVRGQLNTEIDFAMDVELTGANEIPAVTTTATGLAMLRMTSDQKLYAKIMTNGLEADDEWKMAHIHTGTATENGPVLVGIYSTPAEFGTAKIINLDAATINAILNNSLYVNAHSQNHPGGAIRGQIR